MNADALWEANESYTYDAFGRPRVMWSAGPDGNWLTEDVATYAGSAAWIGNPYFFTGRRWDADTGLYYYRMRDYGPDLGRFLQADPIGYADGMNLYAYCGNNPGNWVDPWGESVWRVIRDALAESWGQTKYYFGNLQRSLANTVDAWTPSAYGVEAEAAGVVAIPGSHGPVAGGGHVVGVSRMRGAADGWYGFSSTGLHNYGLDLGVTLKVVAAWGDGPWTGRFNTINVGCKGVSVNVFWNPERTWAGVAVGPAVGFPVTAAYEETDYEPLPDYFIQEWERWRRRDSND